MKERSTPPVLAIVGLSIRSRSLCGARRTGARARIIGDDGDGEHRITRTRITVTKMTRDIVVDVATSESEREYTQSAFG
jgi:hypothetical protein